MRNRKVVTSCKLNLLTEKTLLFVKHIIIKLGDFE